MIREELRAIKSSDSDLRRFSYVMCAALALIGCYHWWSTTDVVSGWFLAGGIILLAGVVKPGVLKPLHFIWMGLAVVLGHIMAVIILCLLYYLIVTPIGLTMRLFGKDVLNRKFNPRSSTYWIDRRSEQWTTKRAEAQF